MSSPNSVKSCARCGGGGERGSERRPRALARAAPLRCAAAARPGSCSRRRRRRARAPGPPPPAGAAGAAFRRPGPQARPSRRPPQPWAWPSCRRRPSSPPPSAAAAGGRGGASQGPRAQRRLRSRRQSRARGEAALPRAGFSSSSSSSWLTGTSFATEGTSYSSSSARRRRRRSGHTAKACPASLAESKRCRAPRRARERTPRQVVRHAVRRCDCGLGKRFPAGPQEGSGRTARRKARRRLRTPAAGAAGSERARGSGSGSRRGRAKILGRSRHEPPKSCAPCARAVAAAAPSASGARSVPHAPCACGFPDPEPACVPLLRG